MTQPRAVPTPAVIAAGLPSSAAATGIGRFAFAPWLARRAFRSSLPEETAHA